MSRVSHAQMLTVAEGLSAEDRLVTNEVARLRLVSHTQLGRLRPSGGSSPASSARLTRKRLQRLHELRVLDRLDRRIGGFRAGSAGHVYYLGSVGQRLLAYWKGDGLVRGRRRPEPGAAFVGHRLSVSELYVTAREHERAGALDLLGFDVEPDCWRRSLTGFGAATTLKPDAYVRLGLGAYEDSWFIEVDLGTESRTVLRNKLRTYLDYFHTGAEQADSGVFPRVLWLTNTEARRKTLVDLCAALPEEYWRLFAVNLLERGIDVMTGEIADTAHDLLTGAAT